MKPITTFIFSFFIFAGTAFGLDFLIYNAEEVVEKPSWKRAEGGYATRSIEFTLDHRKFTVTHLGFLDDYRLGHKMRTKYRGLNSSHEVGLFTAKGKLLASVRIDEGDGSDYRLSYKWKELDEPVVLQPNRRYLLAGTNSSPDRGGEFYGDLPAEEIETSAPFTIHQTAHFAWSREPKGLTFPNRMRHDGDPVILVNLAGYTEGSDDSGFGFLNDYGDSVR